MSGVRGVVRIDCVLRFRYVYKFYIRLNFRVRGIRFVGIGGEVIVCDRRERSCYIREVRVFFVYSYFGVGVVR